MISQASLPAFRNHTCGIADRSRVKNYDSDIGVRSSTFFSELTDGLTRFCSSNEIRPFVMSARLTPIVGSTKESLGVVCRPCRFFLSSRSSPTDVGHANAPARPA